MAGFTVNTERTVPIDLDPPGSLQGLIDQLIAVAARNSTDGTSFVQRIQGGATKFTLTLTKNE